MKCVTAASCVSLRLTALAAAAWFVLNVGPASSADEPPVDPASTAAPPGAVSYHRDILPIF
jgi:hypothetical protein